MTHLSITSDIKDLNGTSVTCLTFTGGADGTNDAAMNTALDGLLADESVSCVCINGKELEYIDSRFIGRLVDFSTKMRGRNGGLVLVDFHENALDTLEVVGVLNLIPHVASFEEAASHF